MAYLVTDTDPRLFDPDSCRWDLVPDHYDPDPNLQDHNSGLSDPVS